MESFVLSIVYYFLVGFLLAFAVAIFFSQNSIHSTFFLILCFITSAVISILLGAEFVGLLLIMVYVGAVSVLFLFVIMMISSKENLQGSNFTQAGYLNFHSINIYLALIFILDVFIHTQLVSKGPFYPYAKNKVNPYFSWLFDLPKPTIMEVGNLKTLGLMLFNDYNAAVLVAGFILLVSLIGAVCLTINFKKKSNLNESYSQLSKEKGINKHN
jgi:NADH-quinone oxidoreductase subunit J